MQHCPIKRNVKKKVFSIGSMPMFFSRHSAQPFERRLREWSSSGPEVVVRGANLPETFADAGESRHEGLRLNKKSKLKLINWHTGEPVVSFQPSFSFTSK